MAMDSEYSLQNCLVGLYEKAIPNGYSLQEKLQIAKQNGYDFMELSVDESDEKIARLSGEGAKEVVRVVREGTLPVLTMCLSANRRFPIGSEQESVRARGVAIIKEAVDLAVSCGIRIVQLAGYDEYYCEQNENTKERFCEALIEVVGYASRHATMLAIENVDTPFMDTLEKILKYVKKIDSPWLGIYADIANLSAAGLSSSEIEKNIHAAQRHTVAWHVKDGRIGVLRHVNYGDGIVDFKAFFAKLQQQRYQGLFVMELWAEQNKDPIAYLKTARQGCPRGTWTKRSRSE